MLRPRIIPCLLVQNGALVKTVKFAEPKYIGDPLNAVRIFNEKEVDELIILDIDATMREQEPHYGLIEKLAVECRMPICYGGGVKTIEQIQRVIGLGIEKVAISSAAVEQPRLVSDGASCVGSQSIVVVIDAKKNPSSNGYELYTHNATRLSGLDPIMFAMRMEKLGAGEIIINSIDRDGMMTGYDIDLATSIRKATNIPMTVLGGAGSLSDIVALFNACGIVGAAAGSLFVFKGKYRAVLLNYPNRKEKDALVGPITELWQKSANTRWA
jgi:cyclase